MIRCKINEVRQEVDTKLNRNHYILHKYFTKYGSFRRELSFCYLSTFLFIAEVHFVNNFIITLYKKLFQ